MAQQTIHYIYPMPVPGTPNAPLFKGKYVSDFLDTLEALASSSQIPFEHLPGYVLRYCHRRVRDVIEAAPHWTQPDWAVTRAYLIKLYGSNDRKPHISADKVRKWIKHHSRDQTFNSLQDVDQYYREYMTKIPPLLSMHFITSVEADLLFFRGIPRDLQVKICDQLPEAQTKVHSPPPIDDVLSLLQNEFNQDDILIKDDTDIESDSDISDADNHKMSWKPKKKVKYSANMCFTASPPPATTFPVPLPSQDIPFDLQPYQGSIPGTDNIFSISTLQEQAPNIKDPPQVNAEDDDTAAGDVEPSGVPDTLITPSPQPETPTSAPERTGDSNIQHDGLPTLIPSTLNYEQNDLGEVLSVRYCLAVKTCSIRRPVTAPHANVIEQKNSTMFPQSLALHANGVNFISLFYAAQTTRLMVSKFDKLTASHFALANCLRHKITDEHDSTTWLLPPLPLTLQIRSQSLIYGANRLVLQSFTSKVIIQDIIDADAKEPSHHHLFKSTSKDEVPHSRTPLLPTPHSSSTLSTVCRTTLLFTQPQHLPLAIPKHLSGKDPPSSEIPPSPPAYHPVWPSTAQSSDSVSKAHALVFSTMRLLTYFNAVLWSFVFTVFRKICSLSVTYKIQRDARTHASQRLPICPQVTRSSTPTFDIHLLHTCHKFFINKEHTVRRGSECAELTARINSKPNTPLCHLRKDLQNPTRGRQICYSLFHLFKFVALTHLFRQFLRYSVHDEGIMRSPPHLW
jgi:hypothetical protein